MVKNFRKLMTETKTQIMEVWRTLSKINNKNFTPGISFSNCRKPKTEIKILRRARGGKKIFYL